MSRHYLSPQLFFRPPFFSFYRPRTMNKHDKSDFSLGEQTKLEISETDVFYDDEEDEITDQVPSAHKTEAKEENGRINKEDSTLPYPQPDLLHFGRVDDIDLNEVYPSDEDQDLDDDDDQGNGMSSFNCSLDGKEGDLDGQGNVDPRRPRNKKKKHRKVRTTITREKLAAMNEIFVEYTRSKEDGKNPHRNLKEIGNQLSLGYSTILHKYRQFRNTKMVKGGALIASLQKKRKYKKSLVIEEIIDTALASRPFYTAVELSEYIYNKHNKRFSRSIISRHLGEMGYSYKNLKSSPIEKNKPKFKETRKVYADIVYPYLSSPGVVALYIDELACNVATFQRRRVTFNPKELYQQNANDYVSLIVGATIEGVSFYHIKYGFFTQEEYLMILQKCLSRIVKVKFGKRSPANDCDLIVITDMNKIHLDPFGAKEDQKPIKSMIRKYNARRFYLPPASPHLNPLESMFAYLKTKLLKKDIKSSSELKNYMQSCMEQMSKVSVEVYFEDAVKCVEAAMGEESFSYQDRPSGFSFDCLE